MKGYKHIIPDFRGSDRLGHERGAGLVEILVTLAIASIAIAAFLVALSMGSFSVATVRERVTAENLARTQLEIIKASAYITGAIPISYTTQYVAEEPYVVRTPRGYDISVDVSYWYSCTQAFTTTAACDCVRDCQYACDYYSPESEHKDCCCAMQYITVTILHNARPAFTVVDYKIRR